MPEKKSRTRTEVTLGCKDPVEPNNLNTPKLGQFSVMTFWTQIYNHTKTSQNHLVTLVSIIFSFMMWRSKHAYTIDDIPLMLHIVGVDNYDVCYQH